KGSPDKTTGRRREGPKFVRPTSSCALRRASARRTILFVLIFFFLGAVSSNPPPPTRLLPVALTARSLLCDIGGGCYPYVHRKCNYLRASFSACKVRASGSNTALTPEQRGA